MLLVALLSVLLVGVTSQQSDAKNYGNNYYEYLRTRQYYLDGCDLGARSNAHWSCLPKNSRDPERYIQMRRPEVGEKCKGRCQSGYVWESGINIVECVVSPSFINYKNEESLLYKHLTGLPLRCKVPGSALPTGSCSTVDLLNAGVVDERDTAEKQNRALYPDTCSRKYVVGGTYCLLKCNSSRYLPRFGETPAAVCGSRHVWELVDTTTFDAFACKKKPERITVPPTSSTTAGSKRPIPDWLSVWLQSNSLETTQPQGVATPKASTQLKTSTSTSTTTTTTTIKSPKTKTDKKKVKEDLGGLLILSLPIAFWILLLASMGTILALINCALCLIRRRQDEEFALEMAEYEQMDPMIGSHLSRPLPILEEIEYEDNLYQHIYNLVLGRGTKKRTKSKSVAKKKVRRRSTRDNMNRNQSCADHSNQSNPYKSASSRRKCGKLTDRRKAAVGPMHLNQCSHCEQIEHLDSCCTPPHPDVMNSGRYEPLDQKDGHLTNSVCDYQKADERSYHQGSCNTVYSTSQHTSTDCASYSNSKHPCNLHISSNGERLSGRYSFCSNQVSQHNHSTEQVPAPKQRRYRNNSKISSESSSSAAHTATKRRRSMKKHHKKISSSRCKLPSRQNSGLTSTYIDL